MKKENRDQEKIDVTIATYQEFQEKYLKKNPSELVEELKNLKIILISTECDTRNIHNTNNLGYFALFLAMLSVLFVGSGQLFSRTEVLIGVLITLAVIFFIMYKMWRSAEVIAYRKQTLSLKILAINDILEKIE